MLSQQRTEVGTADAADAAVITLPECITQTRLRYLVQHTYMRYYSCTYQHNGRVRLLRSARHARRGSEPSRRIGCETAL